MNKLSIESLRFLSEDSPSLDALSLVRHTCLKRLTMFGIWYPSSCMHRINGGKIWDVHCLNIYILSIMLTNIQWTPHTRIGNATAEIRFQSKALS